MARVRGELRARLEARLPEIEQAVLARVYGISDPADADPSYLDGLRSSVSVALDYALEAIERGEERAPPPPPALLAQARMAARNGVGLDIVMRRYFAGYTLLGEFLAAEAEHGLPGGVSPAQFLQGRAAVLDRLLAAVSEEYEREAANRLLTNEQRRAERVERLLAGETVDPSGLEYDFELHHTGLIAVGAGGREFLRELAAGLDCRLLVVRRDAQTGWAWLGARRPPAAEELLDRVRSAHPADLAVALGEPAEGLAGWRLTHRQAAAALPVALRGEERVVRYIDVALLASVLRDDLLASSLRRLYLEPLEAERDGGEILRETLRAYFAAGRNSASAAAALGVTRQTVNNRLRAVEQSTGPRLMARASDLELAIRFAALGN